MNEELEVLTKKIHTSNIVPCPYEYWPSKWVYSINKNLMDLWIAIKVVQLLSEMGKNMELVIMRRLTKMTTI